MTSVDIPAEVGLHEPDRIALRDRVRWTTRSERSVAIGIICLVVVLANATYLLHVFNPNPVNLYSGLGTISQPGVLAGQNNIDANIGFTAQTLGHRAAVDWLHGTIPWWNPYEGLGAPLAGEMQSAALFPLTALTLLSNGQVYFRLALEIVAGIGTYLLLRRFVRSNLPAILGGIAFALNGSFSWLFHAPGNPIAFMPLTLLGIEWAREGAEQSRRRGWILIAISIALALYAGFPETAFIDGLLCALWWGVRAFGLSRRSLVIFAQSTLLGAGLAILLAAPILIAFTDYLPHADVGGHSGYFSHVSISASQGLPMQVMPYLFGPIFGFSNGSPALTNVWDNIGGYLGVTVTLLAIIGLAGRRYRPLRIALAAWIVLGLARLVGFSWALHIINAIPGVKQTAFYRYGPPSWELALVILAALGIDDVMQRSISRRYVVGSGLIMVALCLLGWHVAQPVLHSISDVKHSNGWAVASLSWALMMVVGVILICVVPDFDFAGMSWARARPIALAAVVTLDVVAMFATPQFSAPRQAILNVRPVSYLEQHLGQERFFTLAPLAPNYGSYFGIASVNMDDVPVPKAFEHFVNQHLDTNVDPLSFNGNTVEDASGPTPVRELMTHLAEYEAVGVKYVIVPAGTTLPSQPGGALPVVYSDLDVNIVQLPHPAPVLGALGPGCTVRPVSASGAVVHCRERSRIVYRELNMPGWHVSVDGGSAGLRPYDTVFQSVEVPAGTSTVQFSFTPPHAPLAVLAFIVGVGVLLVAWARTHRVRLMFRQIRAGGALHARRSGGEPSS